MNRAVAMSAASAFFLVLATGWPNLSGSNAAAAEPAPKTAEAANGANPDTTENGLNLPVTLDGEIKRAQELRAKGDYDEALRSLAQLMLFAPDDPRVVGEYGKVLEQEGRSHEALAYLKRAVELQPRDWALHSALGVAYDQLDDHTSARSAYDRALSLKPGEGSVLNNYGVSRMLAGDYPTARKLFAQAAAAGSPNPKIALNLDKLADINPPPQPAPTPAATMAKAIAPAADNHMPLPVVVQAAVAPKAVTQRVPSDTHLAVVKTVPNKSTQLATAAPKPLGPQVVMQRVPVDPLAGPVAHRAATRLAAMQKPKPTAQKPADTTPSLRTAADGN